MPNSCLLEIRNLKTYFYTSDGLVKAVDDVSWEVGAGEVIGLVGESGCGKSVTALSILRLIPDPPGKIVGGEIRFQGSNLLSLSLDDMRKIRGNDISMIFQEPMTSLNPVFTIGDQIAEVLELHQKMSKKAAMEKAVEMLKLVGIPSPERRVKEYPHELSGGMKQRAMIAMALACNPKVLIADEPTTALDVTIQAQILDLMLKLKMELNTAIVLITHDLGVIAEMAQKVVVMYAGKVMEQAEVTEIFDRPLNPYTQGLLNSLPKIDTARKQRLNAIPGIVPSLYDLPKGCKFSPRCQYVMEICHQSEPDLKEVNPGHFSRCWLNQ
ncbi:MAG: ABC transporter ATP-binding protein [candidate division KSB1 bacterium]|nr:ABC transporter ATP-binding protein [candidate division KSB1 bacterium]MDZ7336533.1 ABC transporter ATP-binding protein [candidate division KSB1 bacterium]MDZ7401655.1 ABC transporter ATP-binding protein [candidate division KSB1 bacterium]